HQLIELYSSEGCSSCPPAEYWINQLRRHPQLFSRVIPVVFHVDYWDALGWRDRFASERFSRRQFLHEKEGNLSAVYTPGMLINGREFTGWRRGPLPDLQVATAGDLQVEIHGKELEVTYDDEIAAFAKQLHVARLGFDLGTFVKKGENAHRKLIHDFVVTGYAIKTSDSNIWRMPLPEPRFGATTEALAVWVTRAGSLIPLQATAAWLE
ncbi:MAG: DUF1223 domain-containing protein, partial [Gammaproteobacteria bacterium]